MSKYLVIVESPAKAATIGNYLGPDYIVKSSLGHVRDLAPKSKVGGGMSVDPENNWLAVYEISARHKKVVAELRKTAGGVEVVYLATDPDREGEAIAWHLAEVLTGRKKAKKGFFRRVVFNEITKDSIRRSFSEPGSIDMHLVEAQWSRRFLDRVVGYQLSPLLWKKRGLYGASAGRVQSVALRLLVERERAIRGFEPKEKWEIKAELDVNGHAVEFRLVKYRGKAFTASDRKTAEGHQKALEKLLKDASIHDRIARPLSPRPGAPFITSSLQRMASSQLSLPIRRTMQLAQSLYEAGLITYMRTDSTHLSEEAVDAARKVIAERYPDREGDSYLPAEPRRYVSRKGAQESHEAIRPTRADRSAAEAVSDPSAVRLYDLIYRRFLACQMASPRLLSTKLRVLAGDYELETVGQETLFDGFLRIWPESQAKDRLLPATEKGTAATLKSPENIQAIRKLTQPPRRYNEADLVRELENRGIGRPSTYAETVSTLQRRNYARLEKKRFFVERFGEEVCVYLEDRFPELMNYGFTADMEQGLDRVAKGEVEWQRLLDEFYLDFHDQVEKIAALREEARQVETEVRCSECSKPMILRRGKSGLFLGCSGYKKESKTAKTTDSSCRATMNLTEVVRTAGGKEADGEEEKPVLLGRRCSTCGEAAMIFQVDDHRRLWICSRSPDCSWNQLEQGNFETIKTGSAQKLAVHLNELACSKYPEDHYILREGRNGLFLSASGWPRHKEARSILVSELRFAEDDLKERYDYLLRAPASDPQGLPTEVAFSKKTSSQYVRTAGIKPGEAGWAAFYDRKQNLWKGQEMRPAKAKAGGKKKSGSRNS